MDDDETSRRALENSACKAEDISIGKNKTKIKNKTFEAIQVLQGVDGIDKVEEKFVSVRKLKTIFSNGTGPSLKDVLLHKDVIDLPILVFSIAGRAREGKSLLLNLMALYLENESHGGGDTNKIPDIFPWGNSLYSVTDGVFIHPKIYRMKNKDNKEVGIMLVDTEGLHGGNSTGGEAVAISGIIAAISYLQMFNMKKRILLDDLQSVIMNLVKGIEEKDNSGAKEKIKKDFRLMFIVREWKHANDFPYGFKGGQDYIQSEKQRVKKEHQDLYTTISHYFHETKCVLVPDPGILVEDDEFNQTGDLNLLSKEFLDEVRRLNKSLFHPDNLIPQSIPVTGQDIYDGLKSLDGKTVDDSVAFINIISNYDNLKYVEEWKSSFVPKLKHTSFCELKDVKLEMESILNEAKEKLKGKSRQAFFTSFKQELEDAFNLKLVILCYLQYNTFTQPFDKIEEKHLEIWPVWKEKFDMLVCGSDTIRNKAYLVLIEKSASHYYNILRKNCEDKFEEECSSKNTLAECAGLDEIEIKSFKECEAFYYNINNERQPSPVWLKEYNNLKKQFSKTLLKRVKTIAKISMDTLEKLQRKQYEHFESFTLLSKDEFNFESVSSDNKAQLAKKVGYALFGLPSSIKSLKLKQNSTVEASDDTGYSKDQNSSISPVVDKIIKLSTSSMVNFSCIFLVHIQGKDIVSVPVFKVKTCEGIKYVDSNCRLYDGLNDFMATNTLPDVFFCYPLNGEYVKSKGFWIAFSRTPASEMSEKILTKMDTATKGINLVAGVVGCVAAFGVALPVLAPVAMGVCVVGGGYGLVRTLYKINDKKQHDEPVKKTAYLNVAANCLSVFGGLAAAGRGLITVADAAAVIVARVAGGAAGVNCVTVFFTQSQDTEELISLILKEDNFSVKSLFYFGSTCSSETLKIIKERLNLAQNQKTDDILLALLENNCIKSLETETRGVRSENYVSQNVATLVTSILRAVSSCTRNTVTNYDEILSAFGDIEKNTEELTTERMKRSFEELLVLFESEIKVSKDKLVVFAPPEIRSINYSVLLAFRYLICSLTSEIRKANDFFNNIEHQAITLKYYYVSDIVCHPLHEISQQVKEMVAQKESSENFSTYHDDELDYFLLEVFKLFSHINKDNSSSSIGNFENFLNTLTLEVLQIFTRILNGHKKIVTGKVGLSCHDLDQLIEQIGLEGHNYGLWLTKKVLHQLIEPEKVKEIKRKMADLGKYMQFQQSSSCTYQEVGGRVDLKIMPAWSGTLDDMYYYYSTSPVKDKLELIKQIEDTQGGYENPNYLQDILIYTPSDSDISNLSSFVVYSKLSEVSGESGFILQVKNKKKLNHEEIRFVDII